MNTNKRIAKNTLMLYIRMLLSMIVTLYTSRVVLSVLGVSDYGIYNVVAGVIVMFGFLNSAMAASTVRFLTFENNSNINKLRNIFNVSLTIHALIAVIIFFLAETIGLWFLNSYINVPIERTSAVIWVYQFSVFTFIFNVLSAPFSASIIANEKMQIFALLGIFEVFLKLGVVGLLYFFSFDKLILYALFLFIVSVILRFFESYYCRETFEECKRNKLKWDKVLFIEMGSFAGWNLFGVAAGVGYNQGVNILLNIFFGVTVNASRGIAFQVQGAVSSLITNFQMASAPVITKSFSNNEFDNTLKLVFSTSKLSFYLLLFLSIPLLLQTIPILTFWLDIVPTYAVIFIQLVIIDILINSISGGLHILVQATGNVKKYQIIVSGLLLLNLPTSYLFLKFGYEPETTILISISYSILALFLRLIILKNILNFPVKKYFSNVLSKVILVGFISFLISYLVDKYMINSFGNFLINSLLYSIIITLSVYFLGLSLSEKYFLVEKLKSLFKNNKNQLLN